jgi:alkylation response protein AidB-like acyl-CoA dehydrogenase
MDPRLLRTSSRKRILKRHKGINAFIVEKGWAGFDIGPKEKKMGIRGLIHTLLFQ